ncbi:MAG: hypothetical protein ACTHL8_11145 [Burkholderiaceae bacterium]
MYTGPDSNPYVAVMPPWPLMVGLHAEAGAIAAALSIIGWK